MILYEKVVLYVRFTAELFLSTEGFIFWNRFILFYVSFLLFFGLAIGTLLRNCSESRCSRVWNGRSSHSLVVAECYLWCYPCYWYWRRFIAHPRCRDFLLYRSHLQRIIRIQELWGYQGGCLFFLVGSFWIEGLHQVELDISHFPKYIPTFSSRTSQQGQTSSTGSPRQQKLFSQTYNYWKLI